MTDLQILWLQQNRGAFNDYVDTILSFFTTTYLYVDTFFLNMDKSKDFLDPLPPLY